MRVTSLDAYQYVLVSLDKRDDAPSPNRVQNGYRLVSLRWCCAIFNYHSCSARSHEGHQETLCGTPTDGDTERTSPSVGSAPRGMRKKARLVITRRATNPRYCGRN